jgi:phosphoadenosine phosphosulfate reductase
MSDESLSNVFPWNGVNLRDTRAVLGRALGLYHPRIALACSFSLEDAVIIDMVSSLRPDARVFALDTGRLNSETYECAEALRKRYATKFEWFFPQHTAVEELEREKGVFSFRESVENRKECCGIRKVEPLKRALQGLDAWITGLRREQSVTRGSLEVVDVDEVHGGIAKVNPLAAWTLQDLWDYTREHSIPYNKLYDRGYASIGCQPCTRPIQPGEDQRAGRWWWEQPEHKECGLHVEMKSWHPAI